MPKMKTNSGAKKRFKVTKNGKVKRANGYKSICSRRNRQNVKDSSAVPASFMRPSSTAFGACFPTADRPRGDQLLKQFEGKSYATCNNR